MIWRKATGSHDTHSEMRRYLYCPFSNAQPPDSSEYGKQGSSSTYDRFSSECQRECYRSGVSHVTHNSIFAVDSSSEISSLATGFDYI